MSSIFIYIGYGFQDVELKVAAIIPINELLNQGPVLHCKKRRIW